MAEDGDTGLPPGVEKAWGLRERPGKGPKPALSVERVVAAGVALADAEGLPAVSMSRVAGELGVSTMSLYRYVASKDELLILMEDAASGTPPEGPGPEAGWRPAIASWARDLRGLYHRHLWMLRLPVATPPATPNSVAWMERALAGLRDTGLDASERLGVLTLVSGFVRQQASLVADVEAASRSAGTSVDATMTAYGRLLTRLTDPERFPETTEVLKAGVMSRADGPDDEFVFGLDRLLDGVAVLVHDRSR